MVSHWDDEDDVVMAVNLLILSGTIEATRLAAHVAEVGIEATLSFAGRVERLKPQPIPVSRGGFGGVQGLAEYIMTQNITHVIDATHPFAVQMSRNAVDACALTGTPLVALTRAPWTRVEGDDWTVVPDLAAAAAALAGPARSVMLAVGRMHLDLFSSQPQHSYLLRLVDPPAGDITLPDYHAIVDRGPFTFEDDLALLRDHNIELIVSKNAGGSGARSKIDAARALGIKVIMVDRPDLERARNEMHDIPSVMAWLDHFGKDRGV